MPLPPWLMVAHFSNLDRLVGKSRPESPHRTEMELWTFGIIHFAKRVRETEFRNVIRLCSEGAGPELEILEY